MSIGFAYVWFYKGDNRAIYMRANKPWLAQDANTLNKMVQNLHSRLIQHMASPSHSLSWSKSFGLCLYKLRVTLSMAC